jgi:predicted TPR repeat methyltransferase
MKKENKDETPQQDNELEKLRAENEELRRTMRRAEVHRQITGELTAAGARSPELLLKVIGDGDLEKAASDASAFVAKLRGKYPEQFASADVGDIDGGSGRRTATLTREMLAAMTPQEIAELDWNEVRSILSA